MLFTLVIFASQFLSHPGGTGVTAIDSMQTFNFEIFEIVQHLIKLKTARKERMCTP